MQKEMLRMLISQGFKAKNAKSWIERLGGQERVAKFKEAIDSKCTRWLEDHFSHLKLREGGAEGVLKVSMGIVGRCFSLVTSDLKEHSSGKYGYLTYSVIDGKEAGKEGSIIIYTLRINDVYELIKKITEGNEKEALRLPNTDLDSLEISEVKEEYLKNLWEENILITPELAIFPFRANIRNGQVFNTQEIEQVEGLLKGMVHRSYHHVFAALKIAQMLNYMLELRKLE